MQKYSVYNLLFLFLGGMVVQWLTHQVASSIPGRALSALSGY